MIENIDNSEIENNYFITAIYEDNSRQRFAVSNSILAKDFVDQITEDNNHFSPEITNICLVHEGHIFEEDEPLFSQNISPKTEISINVVFNPYLDKQKKKKGFHIYDSQIILDQGTLEELGEVFPLYLATGGRRRTRDLSCFLDSLKKMIYGYFLAVALGPFSLLAMPCTEMEMATLMGMVLGFVTWLFMFLAITSKYPYHTQGKKTSMNQKQ